MQSCHPTVRSQSSFKNSLLRFAALSREQMERDGAKDTRNAAQEALNACRAACNSKVSQLSLGGL